MERLISNTDFGFYVRELEIKDHKKLELRESYDLFLKQPLNLGMFVPCKLVDGVWVVLEEPIFTTDSAITELSKVKEYQEAKSNRLFEIESYTKNRIKSTSWYEYRFTFTNGKYFDFEEDTVYILERLCEFEPTLTPTAQKQIY